MDDIAVYLLRPLSMCLVDMNRDISYALHAAGILHRR